MKFLVMCLLSLCLFSCTMFKGKVNDVKVETAKKGKEYVTKELKSCYEGIVIEGVNCESEAEKIGIVVEDEVLKFLKADVKVAAVSDKSMVGGVVIPAVCSFVTSSVIPKVSAKIKTEYVCLRACGTNKIVEIGSKLCDQIK